MKIVMKLAFVLMLATVMFRWPAKAFAYSGPPPGCSTAPQTCGVECQASCGNQGVQCDNSCSAIYAGDPYAIQNCTQQCVSIFQQCMPYCISVCVAAACGS